jgi:hypothetical protein
MKVTGCHDCPFGEDSHYMYYCKQDRKLVLNSDGCPLKKSKITIEWKG